MPVGLKWSGRLMALQYPIITFLSLLATTCSLFAWTGQWLCGASQLALNFILNFNQAGLWWLIEGNLGIPGLSYNFLARQYLRSQKTVWEHICNNSANIKPPFFFFFFVYCQWWIFRYLDHCSIIVRGRGRDFFEAYSIPRGLNSVTALVFVINRDLGTSSLRPGCEGNGPLLRNYHLCTQ